MKRLDAKKNYKGCNMRKKISSGLISIAVIAGLSLGVVLLAPDSAHAVIDSCDDCHGAPPVDGTARNNPSGQFPGSHNVHSGTGAGQYGLNCEICHVAPNYTWYSHQSDTVQVNLRWLSMNASDVMQSGSAPGWGSYSRGTSFTNWSTMPATNFGTCSNTYCHSRGDGGIKDSARPITANISARWGTITPGCSSCHGQEVNNPGTGAPWYTSGGANKANSHMLHAPGASGAGVCSRCHFATTSTGNTITSIGQHIKRTYSVVPNTGAGISYTYAYSTLGGTCTTSSCHGTGSSRRWGTNTATATCVKCHGVRSTTVAAYTTVNFAAPGFNGTGVDTWNSIGTVTSNVSNNPRVGAHDAHLRALGGYVAGGVACANCHTAPSNPYDAAHMNGTINLTFSSLARNAGNNAAKWTTLALSTSYAGGRCQNVYCHGGSAPAGVSGTGWTSISWTDGAYLANAAATKNQTDCSRCHLSPPTRTTLYDHGGTFGDCAGCHNHEGSGPTHIDGTLYGIRDCNGCHWYDTNETGAWTTVTKAAGGSYTNQGGKLWLSTNAWGAHVKHINHLKARYVQTLWSTADTYTGNNVKAVCGFCHSQQGGDHMTVSTRQIIWNTTTHQFGASPMSWSTLTRSCSNLDCHYKPTPVW